MKRAAVISSVFSQLREKVGEPYKSFPIDSFVFLEGGMAGWGELHGMPRDQDTSSAVGKEITLFGSGMGAGTFAPSLFFSMQQGTPISIPGGHHGESR